MPESLTEMVVERCYRFNNYLVERNLAFKDEEGSQFWSDLDILAVKDEVILVNCKDYVARPEDKERIVKNLDQAQKYLEKEYPNLTSMKFKLQFVYGGADKKTLQFLSENGIECIKLEAIFTRYIKSIETFMEKLHLNSKKKYSRPKGKRWALVGNLEGVDKLLSYLLNCGFLKEEKLNACLPNPDKPEPNS